jgi:hypothetical protein
MGRKKYEQDENPERNRLLHRKKLHMRKSMERTFIDFTTFPILSAEIEQDLSSQE